MRRPVPILKAAAAALALLAPGTAAAQVSAAVGVSATISTTALSVAQTNDLDFGAVVPGVARTINPRTSASAGGFLIHGARNAEVAITMTLPNQLSTGFWTMPISFSNTAGCWLRFNIQFLCTSWNPANPLVTRIRNSNPPNNTLFIWMGGTVTPAAGQHHGMYMGTITMSVVYTGN